MPTRFERWMRSKLSAMTALTPSSSVPFAAQSRDEPVPYSLPAMTIERRAFGLVFHRGVVDRQLLSARHVQRVAAFDAVEHLVADADVGERAAHHHVVVAAPRAVRVEIRRLHAVLDQVAPRGRILLDVAGRRDVIGRDRIAEQAEAARALDVADRAGLHRHAVEIRRILDVRRRLPANRSRLRAMRSSSSGCRP